VGALVTRPIGALGPRQVEFGGSELGPLRESNDIAGDVAALRARMQEDGYLFLRGFHDPTCVARLREHLISDLVERGEVDLTHDRDRAVVAPSGRGRFSWAKGLTRSREFLDVVDSERVMSFFGDFLGDRARTYDFKWLRAVGPGGATGAHMDVVYMGQGTRRDLFTVWTPVGDVSIELGGLAILEASHRLPAYEKIRRTYGRMDVDRDRTDGWFSDDPLELSERYGGSWKTAEFRAGDAVLFGMYTMHAGLRNQTDRFRLSVDTRYRPWDAAVDARWVGDEPPGHSIDWGSSQNKPMRVAREEWGV
jgi:hypothetical protein